MADNFEISIFGGGNVATHLAQEILKHPELKLKQMYNRHLTAIQGFGNKTHITDDLTQILPADLFILAITDDAIEDFSEKLAKFDNLTVHTAGSVPMNVLKTKRKGVFYPFQSFSKNKKQINFQNIPILIEAAQPKDLKFLKKIGEKFSNNVIEADSTQRKALHIAGVFAANFVNHLYLQASKILKNNNLPFDLVKPLILEVAQKVQKIPPKKAQTGPAVRGDIKVVNEHLTFLKDENQNKIYKLLTQSIFKEYKNE